jgi:type III secretion protein J
MRARAFALAALGLLAAGGAACMVPVQHGLDESAANEVVTALERAGIGAEKGKEEGGADGAFIVRVSRGDAPRALELLRTVGLPRGRRSGLGEMYAQPSLVPTATEERARFVEALSSEVERTLETIEGVVSARVHVVLAETDPLALDGKPRVPAQAAVLLKARTAGARPLKEADVQKLVAGSVPGLEPGRVAVVVTPAPEWSQTAPPAFASVGPLRVAPGSRAALVGILAAALALVAVLAALLLASTRRNAALQREAGGRT